MKDERHLSFREQLGRWLAHLEHVLPAQAPIRDFVHHNTLHGFQHLPFFEALAAARRLTGAAPYLPEERFREFFREGRINRADLAAALEDSGVAGLDLAVAGELTRRDILIASLLEPGEPPAAARLAWEGRESAATDPALWAACRAAARSGAAPERRPWRQEASACWQELAGRVGKDWTLRALLQHLTGEDVLETVRTILLRHLAAHLDLGVAAWHNPRREQGFYAAWRASAGVDFAWDLDELRHVRDEIASLPDDPLAALLQELSALLPDAEYWPGYLERLCLELPGWSGMFLRRDRHPGGAPAAMADYLAVRVALERLLTEDLVRRLAGAPMSLEELGGYFAGNPAELYVRHGVRAFALPDELLHRADVLMHDGGDAGFAAEAEWNALAEAVAVWRAGEEAGEKAGDGRVWLLYRRARRLGLTAAALRELGEAGAAALAQCAGEFDALARGRLWLLAYERHYREEIFAALAAHRARPRDAVPPAAQVVFCMDDREEGSRRHLEDVAPAVETFGAAGFFGVPMYWQGLDEAAPTALCPVTVRPAHLLREEPLAAGMAASRARRRAWRLAWRERFVQGTRRGALAAPVLAALAAPAALFSLTAASLAPGRFGEALRRWRERFEGPVATRPAVSAAADAPATPENPRIGFTDEEQAGRVAAFLTSIGLAASFAPLVAMLGHGSASRNNPHQSAYDCGACSGRHGGPNARAFAAMANRPPVRARLAAQGIAIPEDTWFVAGEHNTCDDSVEWYDEEAVPPARRADFARLQAQLAQALRRHAAERCRRFAVAPADPSPAAAARHVLARRHDISEARPELGHATNAAAFVGRRAMSRGLFLDRRVFLISYDPEGDPDGSIVESILLAAGPVGAGISLEYYFSTVDNERFGCGSKITHNLAGLFGVMEGADSDLRTGLPRQMIEIHEPMRLLVVVEQTPALLSAIVARQPALQELILNEWIVVAACEPDSGRLHRFCPRRGWLPWEGYTGFVPTARENERCTQ